MFFNLKNDTKIEPSVNRPITVEEVERLSARKSRSFKRFQCQMNIEGAGELDAVWIVPEWRGTLVFFV